MSSGDRDQIEARIRQFIDAFHSGDLESLLSTYSDDLIKARADLADEAKPQTAARLEQVFRDYDRQLAVRNDEIVVQGSLAYVRGVLDITLTPRSRGAAIHAHRRFIEIWRKEEDGEWRVARTMDNRDSASAQ